MFRIRTKQERETEAMQKETINVAKNELLNSFVILVTSWLVGWLVFFTFRVRTRDVITQLESWAT